MHAKILLLEDDELLREELSDSLQTKEYEVTETSRAEDAVEAARWGDFDLLITDVRMPGAMDGIGALEAIKKMRPGLHTIIITGYTDENAPSRAMTQGVDYYLYKPFGLQKLWNVVEMVLATQRDQSTYQHQLSRFFKGSQRFVSSLLGQKEQPAPPLDVSRLHFFKAYFAGMQSKNLTVTGALTVWDQLQNLEARYEQLQQILGPEADELAARYRALQDKAVEFARVRSLGDGKPREPGQMVMAYFSKLYNRAVEGAFGVPVLMAGPVLWLRAQQKRPSGEMGAIWDRLFGPAIAGK